MRRIITFLFFTLLVLSLSAAPVSVKQAQSAATGFVNANFKQTKAFSGQLELVWSDTGMPTKSGSSLKDATFYVFNLTGGDGFVVVSGDDAVYPILGYSAQHAFQKESMPSNLSNWFEGYQDQISWVRDIKPTVSQNVINAWAALNKGSLQLKSDVVLLSTALWDQMIPYNNLCPAVNGQRTPTGCVATSTSIVMQYHKWPNVGQGSFSYTSETYKFSLSVTYDTPYDWNSMPMAYVSGQYTAQQAQNIAKLMFDVGVFSEMNYAPGNSGALTINCARGLVDYMKYDKSLRYLQRVYYQTAEWEGMVKAELDSNRPVIYGGSNDKKEGHQFVLDGYTTDNYYHVNWGWGGLANGYFLLDVLNPLQQGTGGNSGGGFSIGQDAIFGIKKAEANSSNRDVLAFFYGEADGMTFAGISTDALAILPNKSFVVTAGFIANFSIRTFTGTVAIALTDKDGNIKELISPQRSLSLDINNGTGIQFTCKVNSSVASDDQLRAVYKSSDSDTWQWVRGGGDTSGQIFVSSPTPNEVITENADISILFDPSGSILISSSAEVQTVTVYDVNGRMLKKKLGGNNLSVSVPISGLGKGMYIVEVETTKSHSVHKILKR